ncbi:ABC transporter ATP-binding protein [Ectothiorhodospira shaposhnikovii]|uniref:ABC transporter ATP-binding protein n=1 Tax=Ectothiorhodospira shaposhnikovii TaxID=1054 RepID=UPI001EE86802|nr:ABC transporter ATP-binding protein [Ectothiorhodospira shaposhnikovii]MCG5512084.1 ABC transporter ATP-binding protein [Ectothiorhodospira shaposhnikovii]
MKDIVIKIEGLSKAYRLGSQAERPETLVQATTALIKAPLKNLRRLRRLDTFTTDNTSDDILWALKDINLEVQSGEVIGFVGRNGAGKSTLLKILSRITDPTRGRIEIHGRVSSLLEVGTGFHPELTGRENIYMNGTILGMKKREIDEKFEQIVDFSGVSRFLDTPVKRYSSGMKVRLAFSVAAHLEPEILIIDEVLAVGDAEFQRKCLGKMQDVAGSGRTVLFVSHNMAAVQNLCSRAIALRNGELIDEGNTKEVIGRYLSSLMSSSANAFSNENTERQQSGPLRLTSGYLLNGQGSRTESLIAGESATLCFEYDSSENLDDLSLTFTIYNDTGTAITSVSTGLKNFSIRQTGTQGILSCHIPRCPLPLGEYRVAIRVASHGRALDQIGNALRFTVEDSVFFGTTKVPDRQYCTVYIDHEWNLKKTILKKHPNPQYQPHKNPS